MGNGHRWKPAVYAVITVALKESPMRAGPMVTTTLTRTLQRDLPTTDNLRMHIGGTVYDTAVVPRAPVPLAWVELLTPANEQRQVTRADAQGRFVLADVPAGNWRLRASSTPQGVSAPRDIAVPEPSGHYDLEF